MLFVDFAIVRFAFSNRHKISPAVWRSAQPLPHHIRRFAKKGIRTIINLRGDKRNSTYVLEREACSRHGIRLIDFEVRSRAAPSKVELIAARDLFNAIEYPALMHCKSGADRVGLMSALYLHLKDNVPIEQAMRQLSLKYGHLKQANTGVLGYFFQCYLNDTSKTPMPLFEWVEQRYDPNEIKRNFRSKGWANRIVDDILTRE